MRFDREQYLEDLRYLATMDCKWRDHGTSPETGMDCIGVLRWAYERQGLVLPQELLDEWKWRSPPNGNRMLRIMRRFFPEITREETEPSDLMVALVRKNPCHVITKMDDKNIAEAYRSTDGFVSKFLIRPFPDYRIVACFRIPDFA